MFGVVGLLVAAYVAKNLLAVEEKKPEIASRNIPMAVSDIEPGTVITENHLGQGPFPVDRLDRDTLLVNRVVVGRVVKEAIKAAQPIRANQLYKPGELPPLEVAEGMRAVSVEVGAGVAMVDGMIKPGQFVDVLFTYQGDVDSTQGGVTLRLFEGVRIIAINRNFAQSRVDRSSNRVTLELDEPQANIMVLAKDKGEITLTFNPNNERGRGGLSLNNDDRVTLHEILGLRPAEPTPEPFLTESYKGANRSTHLFNEKGRRIENNAAQPTPTRPQMVLPKAPTSSDTTAPTDAVPGPQDAPAAARAPTAARLLPTQN
jgi:pilus assembly protein CpaB